MPNPISFIPSQQLKFQRYQRKLNIWNNPLQDTIAPPFPQIEKPEMGMPDISPFARPFSPFQQMQPEMEIGRSVSTVPPPPPALPETDISSIDKMLRSFGAGVGDIISLTGGTLRWLGMSELGESITRTGSKLQSMAPKDTLGEFDFSDLARPDFYMTKLTRALPFALSLIPFALGGWAGGGAVAGALGLGRIGTLILGSLGSAALSRPMESALEAGQAYDDAISKGKSKEQARQAANQVFRNNLSLAGMDASQIAMTLMPTSKFGLSKLMAKGLVKTMSVGGKTFLVGLSEGGEEVLQDIIQRRAQGEKITFDPAMKEAFAIGAIMGAGMGLSGDVITPFLNNVEDKLPPELKKQHRDNITLYRDEGYSKNTARMKSVNDLMVNPEVDEIVKSTLAEYIGGLEGKVPETAKAIQEVKAELGAEKAKEPWEMTREEFIDYYMELGKSLPSGKRFYDTEVYKYAFNLSKEQVDKLYSDYNGITIIAGKKIPNSSIASIKGDIDNFRGGYVKQALSEGKLVPEEVLKDYPDLVKPEAKIPEAKEIPKPIPGIKQAKPEAVLGAEKAKGWNPETDARTAYTLTQESYDYLNSKNAPDIEYRKMLSTFGKEPLKKGQTWKARVEAVLAKQAKPEAEIPEETKTILEKKTPLTDKEVEDFSGRLERFNGKNYRASDFTDKELRIMTQARMKAEYEAIPKPAPEGGVTPAVEPVAKAVEEPAEALPPPPPPEPPKPVEPGELPDYLRDKMQSSMRFMRSIYAKTRRGYKPQLARKFAQYKAKLDAVPGWRAYSEAEKQMRKDLEKWALELIPEEYRFTIEEKNTIADYIKVKESLNSSDNLAIGRALRHLWGEEIDEDGSYANFTDGDLKAIKKAIPELAPVAEEILKMGISKWRIFLDIMNFPRASMSSTDMSHTLRQGLILLLDNPSAMPEYVKSQFTTIFSQKTTDVIAQQMQEHPLFWLANSKKLYFAPVSTEEMAQVEYEARPEEFSSKLANKLFWIRASARGFSTGGNYIRFNGSFVPFVEGYVNMGTQQEVDVKNYMASNPETRETEDEFLVRTGINEELFKSVSEDFEWMTEGAAKFANYASGRGDLVGFIKHDPAFWNAFLFSPRLLLSRFQLPMLMFDKNVHPAVRKRAAYAFVKFMGFGVSVLSMAALMGAKVEKDPRSTDFGKIRIGHTRIDIWTGYIQWARFLAQFATEERKNTDIGDIQKTNRYQAVLRMIQSKEAPLASILTDLMYGKTYVGDPMFTGGWNTVGRELKNRLTPFAVNDIYEALVIDGWLGGFTASPGLFGAGISTYESERETTKSRRKYRGIRLIGL